MSNELLNRIMNELKLFNKEFLVLLTLDIVEINEETLKKIEDYKNGLVPKLVEDIKMLNSKMKEIEKDIDATKGFSPCHPDVAFPGMLALDYHELRVERDQLLEQLVAIKGGDKNDYQVDEYLSRIEVKR